VVEALGVTRGYNLTRRLVPDVVPAVILHAVHEDVRVRLFGKVPLEALCAGRCLTLAVPAANGGVSNPADSSAWPVPRSARRVAHAPMSVPECSRVPALICAPNVRVCHVRTRRRSLAKRAVLFHDYVRQNVGHHMTRIELCSASSIQEKLDRLDEAFLFERSIDIETYDRYAEKLREELTLARIERHSGQLEELDVEGILAFAERVLPRASDLWVQASLEQRQRSNNSSFPTESRSTEVALLEPAQPHRLSATCGE
jgi:hypothetical protein